MVNDPRSDRRGAERQPEGMPIVQAVIRGLLGASIALVLSATAALAWDATCNSGEACVWKNSSFQVPLAAQASGDSDYSNDTYPNTQDGMNDSVSSIRNRYSSSDVVFYFSALYNGTSYCLNSGWESGSLMGHNDQYSSHLIAIGSTC